ncbi:MAG: preprotein translocase subunit SecE [Candidatus Parcubacteria bacterium]|nr:preprotein translocase subunit SecE [Candidatus Parcubacteria bacterium]
MNIIQKITNYIKDSIAELKKVAWPTKKQTINYTLLIIGISLVLAALIGIADYLLSLGIQQVIK